MAELKPDFSGYATRNDVRCSDGVTIRRDAFKINDGTQVPIFWSHGHNDPSNILGHAILTNRPDGVYATGYFNNTPKASYTKSAIAHGDVRAMSIHAYDVKRRGTDVVDGKISEVSIVYKGANPGAYIDNISLSHSDDDGDYDDGEVIIYTGLEFDHSDKKDEEEDQKPEEEEKKPETSEDSKQESEDSDDSTEGEKVADEEKTIEQAYNELDEETKNLLHYFVGLALENQDNDDNEEDESEGSDDKKEGDSVTHNIFENQGEGFDTSTELTHAQVETIFADAKRPGMTLKDSVLYHADQYGITNIDLLFPDAKNRGDAVKIHDRRNEWVKKVLAETDHSPFAKVKTMIADLTPDSARAKGYIKATMKKEEYFSLIKRETTPATIYKKQKLDRDDVIDITDFDVVAFMKGEMRQKLDEEIARAILIGDGRDIDDEDKVSDPAGSASGKGLRSVMNDDDFYAHKVTLAANVSGATLSEAIIRSMNDYKGTGSPTLFTSRRNLTDMLLLKDKLGRRLYPTVSELTAVLQVKEIVPVEIFDDEPQLIGIIINLRDYTVGADKGGETSFFDDFDIDYNQMKYLYETRLSGGLTMPKSAVVIKRAEGTEATPVAPTFNTTTNEITIPSVTGVEYQIDDKAVTGKKVIEADTIVTAVPKANYFFTSGVATDWVFAFEG